MPAVRLRAAWLLPVAAPPIPGGAVLIGDDGRVATIGPDADVPSPPGIPIVEYPDAIVIPGLVNAHTHLELTGFRDIAPETDFPVWVRTIRRLKQHRSRDEFLAAARTGLRACRAGGVTTVADTGDSGAVIEVLAEAGGSGVVYHEVFGPHPDQCAGSMTTLAARVAELERFTSERVRLGVSPHAPYSVSGPLYRAVHEFAEASDYPVAVHVAESEAEAELIRASEGPFAAAWTERGIPLPDSLEQLDQPVPRRTPVGWLEANGVLGPLTLAIHAIRLDRADIISLARHEVAVAHCPLSNERHGHGRAPLRELLEAGVRVGIGTDSEASVGPLDLFAELREARRIGGLAAAATLGLGTLDGALAIGVPDVGGLTPGYWGDVCVIDVAGSPLTGLATDPVELALAASPADVMATWLAGNEVWRRT